MVKVMKARIAYTGPALENGEMDVRDLAPFSAGRKVWGVQELSRGYSH